MCRLLETIKIYNNKIFNLEYHNKRLNRARQDLFGISESIDLRDYINPPLQPDTIIKCRVIYAQKIENIIYQKYKPRNIKSLKLIFDDSISYPYKYEDRQELNKLLSFKNECDDILIVKRKKITDTSFSNIIFFDGAKWLTPAEPLLYGTKRAELIAGQIIAEVEILLSDLHLFKKALLINAMLDFNEANCIAIENILF